VTLNPEQFRPVTNLKATPGSQGTLFQGGYPTSYHRGYTPERQRDVTKAAKWLDPKNIYHGHAPATAAMRDTVARSTVPVEHVQGVYFSATAHAAKDLETSEARGTYHAPDTTALNASLIKVHPDAVRGGTAIHEIGHHVSHEIEKTEHSAYDTGARRGREEGFAENYMETHFRDRRGRPRASGSTAQNWTHREKDSGHRTAFQTAFHDERAASPLAPKQFDYNAMTLAERGLPASHVEGQLPLIDKRGSGEMERYEGGTGQRMKKVSQDWDYTDEDRQRGLKR
jgi:hypothetical protein